MKTFLFACEMNIYIYIYISVKFITYGCQMNINDVELVRSLLLSTGYAETDDVKEVAVTSRLLSSHVLVVFIYSIKY